MYRWLKPGTIDGPFFETATNLDEVMAYFASRPGSLEVLPESTQFIDARCYVCQRNTRFIVSKLATDECTNWCETVVCPLCGLTNRWRSCVHIFESLARPQPDDSIYLTEAVTPLYDVLSRRYPRTTGSEYSAEAQPGAMVETARGPVRNEDVTRLSFNDRSFQSVLSFGVLEHVPDYRAALREFHRVLDSSGQLILSVPFMFGEHTVTRAKLDENGEIEHLLEPVYHGDPMTGAGVLCFQEFGTDLLEEMNTAGFQESFMVCLYAPEWAYFMPQVMFVGRR